MGIYGLFLMTGVMPELYHQPVSLWLFWGEVRPVYEVIFALLQESGGTKARDIAAAENLSRVYRGSVAQYPFY